MNKSGGEASAQSGAGELEPLLAVMVERGASDLFLSAAAPPTLKIHGQMAPLDAPPLTPEAIKALACAVMGERRTRDFESSLECDLALQIGSLGRFRVNIYVQRGHIGVVARHIPTKIPSLDALHMPAICAQLAELKRGLVLMVGAAGSGKSTTLAAMIDHRNRTLDGHILTIEDPIEFVHEHRRSLVDQREVGLDTHSFGEALRHAMREAPDVIMIGEIRDRETMQQALAYAETGHLCLSTLHASNANQAVQRILNFFPEDARRQLLMDLSLNLQGVVAQRLVKSATGPLVPAVELMLLTPFIADLIQKGQIDELKDAIANGNEQGMLSFDQSLYQLYRRGLISAEQAIDYADSKTDVSLRIRLEGGKVSDISGIGMDRDPH